MPYYIVAVLETEDKDLFSSLVRQFESQGLSTARSYNDITILPTHMQVPREKNPTRRAMLNMLRRMKSKIED